MKRKHKEGRRKAPPKEVRPKNQVLGEPTEVWDTLSMNVHLIYSVDSDDEPATPKSVRSHS
jgi:hypothetical protein